MGIVNALKFGPHSGAIITDEEYWHMRRRKTYFTENLFPLLEPEEKELLNIEAIYGGCNLPSFDYEVVAKTKKKISEKISASRTKGRKKKTAPKTPFKTVEEIGKLTLQTIHEIIRRRVDEKLLFLFGFTADDLSQGYFEEKGGKIGIKQEVVKRKAMNILTWKDKNPLMKPVFGSRSVLVGHDPVDGFSWFHYNIEKTVQAYVSGGFESIGTGKYAGGQSFARFIKGKNIAERRKGFDRKEGIFELVRSAIDSEDYYHEAGGYFHIMYINGKGKSPGERFIEVSHHGGKLASEIVRAWQAGEITKKRALSLLDDLVFKRRKDEEVDAQLFKAAKNPQRLDLVLRGYKFDHDGHAARSG